MRAKFPYMFDILAPKANAYGFNVDYSAVEFDPALFLKNGFYMKLLIIFVFKSVMKIYYVWKSKLRWL